MSLEMSVKGMKMSGANRVKRYYVTLDRFYYADIMLTISIGPPVGFDELVTNVATDGVVQRLNPAWPAAECHGATNARISFYMSHMYPRRELNNQVSYFERIFSNER